MKDTPLFLLIPTVLIIAVVGVLFVGGDKSSVETQEVVNDAITIDSELVTTSQTVNERPNSKTPSEEPINITVAVQAPADVVFTDSEGVEVNLNETKEAIFSRSGYNELSYETKNFSKENAEGVYTVEVVGVEYGQYKFNILILSGNSVAMTKEVVALIKPGQVDTYTIDTDKMQVSTEAKDYLIIATNVHRAGGCVESAEYFAVTEKKSYRDITKAFVYKKDLPGQIGECKLLERAPIFIMDFDNAEYLDSLLGNFLILDRGTGPSRAVVVYNLSTKEELFSEGYGNFVTLHPPDTIGYWRKVDTEPTLSNCPQKTEYESSYLSAEIQEYTLRNLMTGFLESHGTNCVARQ